MAGGRMADKKDLLAELYIVTSKLSSQVWVLNLGVLGTTWTSLISSSSVADKFKFTFAEARWIFLLCILGLLSDLLQYLCAYATVKETYEKMEELGSDTAMYDYTSIYYRLRGAFFGLKIAITVLAAIWLLIVIFMKASGAGL
jgi:hypothetical protein